jgi:hypothetical protein
MEAIELLRNTEPIYWVFSIIGLLIIPLVIGFMPYQAVVWFFELSIKALTWVQLKSHTGVVGMLGFFYLQCSIGGAAFGSPNKGSQGDGFFVSASPPLQSRACCRR